MSDKTCEEFQCYLSRYIDGELSESETRLVENHLQFCQRCKETITVLRSVSSHLENAFATMGSIESIKQRLGRFLASIPGMAKQKKRPAFFPTWSWPPSWRTIACVEMLLLCVGILGMIVIANLMDAQVRAKVGRPNAQERQISPDMLYFFEGKGGKKFNTARGTMLGREVLGSGLIAEAEGAHTEGAPVLGEAYASQKGVQITDQRKVIRHAEISVVVENVSIAREELERIIRQHGGMVAKASVVENEKSPWARLTLWVPSEHLDQIIDQLSGLGKMQSLDMGAEDITEQYFDLDTRVRNLKRQEERLLALYDREVKKLDEILKVEKEIGRTRTEIERLEGRQRMWDRQIRLSTIQIRLTQEPEKEPIAVSEPDDVLSPLRRAIRDASAVFLYSCSILTTLVSWVISSVVFLGPWLLLSVLFWYIGKGILRLWGR